MTNEMNIPTWLTTDISIEKPKNDPLWGIDTPAGTALVTSGMANCVGKACAPGGGGGFSVVGLYAAAPV